MRSYGQYCPVSRASEILAERWTPIILRNLLYGCTTFSELAAGAPGISRTLLSQRLREFERAEIIEIRPKPDGNGSTYELTPAGRELWTVLKAMGDWGKSWLELAPATASPDVVLWSWCTAYLARDRLPDGRVLVRFDFPDQPAPRRRLWILVEDGDAEVCQKHPGFDEDVVVVVEDARTFARWHMGLLEWGDALRAGDIRVSGPRHLARSLPTWNRRRRWPREEPEAGETQPGPQSVRQTRSPGSRKISGFAGQLLRPGDSGYDAARRVWNGAIDRRPAYIARCADADDVVAALGFARESDLVVAVRGGGHGVAGTALCDDGLVIDLSAMKDIEVQPGRRIARVGGGVLWGELDAASQAFGLATTGGVVSHTGVAGLTLGGGIGWLMRRFGLTIDNLLAADVVTADGERLTASVDEHSELFWGLRGGGGNFGVVTAFSFRLHPVGPEVLAGPVLWPLEDAPEVLRGYREFMAEAPRELSAIATLRKAAPLPLLPPGLHGRPVCIVTMCYVGDTAAGERELAPLRNLGRPLLDLVDVRPYTAFQRMFDAATPHGWHYYWKSANFHTLADELVDAIAEHSSRIVSPRSYAILFHLGGAVSDVAADATAFPHRDALHTLNINGVWLPDDPGGESEISWTRDFHAAVQPHQVGAYLNFLDRDDHDQMRAAFGDDAYDRLVALKDRYDPENVFRSNHNVHPSKLVAT